MTCGVIGVLGETGLLLPGGGTYPGESGDGSDGSIECGRFLVDAFPSPDGGGAYAPLAGENLSLSTLERSLTDGASTEI